MNYKTDKISKSEALKIWEHEYGDVLYAYDFTGRKIKRDDYMVNNQVGWVVSYIKPLSLGGPVHDGNTIILNHNTAFEKADNYPDFEVVGVKFRIFYDEKEDFYYIQKNLGDLD